MTGIIGAFKAADLSDLPPVDALADERVQALWVLAAGEKAGQPIMTPAEVSIVLRDVYKIALPRQKVQALLIQEKGTVVRRRKGGVRAYQIMQAGADDISTSAATAVVFVEPREAFSKIREAEEILAALKGTLSVCDPYVDGRTLDFLAVCRDAPTIRLLTVNVNKPKPFARDVAAFNKEHGGKLEVRVAAQRDLHDRYMIHNDGLLLFGTSLNGFGKKQSFVVALGPDMQASVSSAFELSWQSATPLG